MARALSVRNSPCARPALGLAGDPALGLEAAEGSRHAGLLDVEPLDQLLLRQPLGPADLDQRRRLRRLHAERRQRLAQPVGQEPRQLRRLKAESVPLVEAHKVLCS